MQNLHPAKTAPPHDGQDSDGAAAARAASVPPHILQKPLASGYSRLQVEQYYITRLRPTCVRRYMPKGIILVGEGRNEGSIALNSIFVSHPLTMIITGTANAAFDSDTPETRVHPV